MRFFVGLHHPNDAGKFDAAFISVNTIRERKSAFQVNDWIMDSGAFTMILKHGGYPQPVSEYAAQIKRWKGNGTLLAAVSQDYMCEADMLKRTGLTVEAHQMLTIERYDALLAEDAGVYIMPVLQGYATVEYIRHLRTYGDRLRLGAWVGIGSVCKRNSNPMAIWKVLSAIKDVRPDLQLHGFGLKKTSLEEPIIRELLATADSMAWSYAARREGRNQNDWREAEAFTRNIADRIAGSTRQQRLAM